MCWYFSWNACPPLLCVQLLFLHMIAVPKCACTISWINCPSLLFCVRVAQFLFEPVGQEVLQLARITAFAQVRSVVFAQVRCVLFAQLRSVCLLRCAV